jgi:Glucose/sorbosone dehydrogenases
MQKKVCWVFARIQILQRIIGCIFFIRRAIHQLIVYQDLHWKMIRSICHQKKLFSILFQREICCHTGGSVAFGGDGNLYLSTGDNSTPFDAPKQPIVNHGFAPLDNRKGFEQYDARRSASNSNDLRGKVIRIKVNDDGTYSIPDGNLICKRSATNKTGDLCNGNKKCISFISWSKK